ncbi:hypothetical protein NL54_19245 [Pantoea stewartii]|nr:hypothetical protein NL54_19245 [Pantoea stewartii]KHN64853.1 hypothetical protein OI73_02750 [Pantoea stewartii]NRH25241.1 hypothetical protein [Pantoea stewartii]
MTKDKPSIKGKVKYRLLKGTECQNGWVKNVQPVSRVGVEKQKPRVIRGAFMHRFGVRRAV